MINPSSIVEHRDALKHLHTAGFGVLIDALRDPTVYTRGGEGKLVIKKLARSLALTPDATTQLILRARAAIVPADAT